MYIDNYTIMGAGLVYIENLPLLQSTSQTKEEEVSVTVLDGEVRIRTIGISKIIVALT